MTQAILLQVFGNMANMKRLNDGQNNNSGSRDGAMNMINYHINQMSTSLWKSGQQFESILLLKELKLLYAALKFNCCCSVLFAATVGVRLAGEELQIFFCWTSEL